VRGVILAYLTGGPSHIDTLDPKPDAPKEIRGDFKTIATTVPGVRIAEHLPRLARILNQMTLIRSMRTTTVVHEMAAHRLFGGVTETPPGTGLAGSRRDRPHLGSLFAAAHPQTPGIPPSIVLPYRMNLGGRPYPGQDAGFLGARFDPWFVTGDPNASTFGPGNLALPDYLTLPRLRNRTNLLANLEGHRRRLDRRAASSSMDDLRRQAIGILTSSACRTAFEIGREDPRLRDRYGRTSMGQGLMLARRLIEAGVPMVQVNMGSPEMWDTHGDGFNQLKNNLLPQFERALFALQEDLTLRGLIDEVLVVATGEFGRAPRIGQPVPGGCGASQNGRDHWGNVYSILAFGAGVRRGQLLGASDRIGAYPATASYTPADLAANILQCLGVNPANTLRDDLGQSFPVNSGTLIPWN
jgi:hypothetical protein